MKTIEVTDEMYASLIELSEELNTQDHRATAMPYFFQIQTQEEVAVPDGCGNEAWHYDGTLLKTDKEINEEVSEIKDISTDKVAELSNDEKEEILEKAGWNKVCYDYKDKYENAFFTAKACKEHIRLNSYHYIKPVDYLSHASRNPELELVLKFLCELTGKMHT
jgi:5'-3' exonuclease